MFHVPGYLEANWNRLDMSREGFSDEKCGGKHVVPRHEKRVKRFWVESSPRSPQRARVCECQKAQLETFVMKGVAEAAVVGARATILSCLGMIRRWRASHCLERFRGFDRRRQKIFLTRCLCEDFTLRQKSN